MTGNNNDNIKNNNEVIIGEHRKREWYPDVIFVVLRR